MDRMQFISALQNATQDSNEQRIAATWVAFINKLSDGVREILRRVHARCLQRGWSLLDTDMSVADIQAVKNFLGIGSASPSRIEEWAACALTENGEREHARVMSPKAEGKRKSIVVAKEFADRVCTKVRMWILCLPEKHNGEFTVKMITINLSDIHYKRITNVLSRMVKNGFLRRIERGRYRKLKCTDAAIKKHLKGKQPKRRECARRNGR